MCWGSGHGLGQHSGTGASTHGSHPTCAALPAHMAGTGGPQQGGDGGRWLWPCPGAGLVVALALPGTTSAVLGWMEATAQAVPPGRATLASHPLQLLKASEQLLIVPGAANEIIAARCWESLPGPAPAWPPLLGTGGCSAPLAQALAPMGFGEHLGHPNAASPPFVPRPLPTPQSAHW